MNINVSSIMKSKKSPWARMSAAVMPYTDKSITISLGAFALVLVAGFIAFVHGPAIQRTANIRKTNALASSTSTVTVPMRGIAVNNIKTNFRNAAISVRSGAGGGLVTTRINVDSTYNLEGVVLNQNEPTSLLVTITVPNCTLVPFRIIVPAAHNAAFLPRNFDATCDASAAKPTAPLKIR